MLDDIKNYFANFDGTTDSCRTVALWITVALVVAFVATKIYAAAAAKFSKRYDGAALIAGGRLLNGAWMIVASVYAVCMIITFSACYFVDVSKGEDVLVPILFYPLIVTVIAVTSCAIAIFVKPHIITKIISAVVCGAALVAVIVCMVVYYTFGDAGEAKSGLGLYLSAVGVVDAVVVFAFLADRKHRAFDTRSITFAAVCIALSFALSYVRIFKMPMGGSITFASMLPLMLFAFMFGSRRGIAAGLIYGVLQAVQDPWIIHPAQFVLDYAVAFSAIGLTGCIRDLGLLKGKMRAQFALGALIAVALRFVSHYFSGVFAFGAYGEFYAAEYNMPVLANEYLYSFVYQCLYLIPELAVTLAVSMIVFASRTFRKQIVSYSDVKAVKDKSECAAPTANADEGKETEAATGICDGGSAT